MQKNSCTLQKHMQKINSISIVIPTIDRINQLERLLISIEQSSHNRYEIVVVNDSGNVLMLKDKTLNIKILDNKKNRGLAFSRTRGATEAKGKYVLFIDDDNVIEKGMIEKLENALDSNPKLIAVGPLTYFLSNKKRIAFLGANISLRTSKTTFASEFTEDALLDGMLFLTGNLHNCFMVRRDLGGKVGWFDEEVFMSGTEFDMFQKIRKIRPAGFLATNVHANCYHDVLDISQNTHNLIKNYSSRKNRMYYYQRNKGLLAARYGTLIDKVFLAFIFYPMFAVTYGSIFIKCRSSSLFKENFLGVLYGYLYLIGLKRS